MPKPSKKHDLALKALRAFGLAYPATHTKSPWPGHLDLAVKDKTFAYLSLEGDPLSISCKLPESSTMALMLPFAKPTGYGLGKSSWVTATFSHEDDPPLDMLKDWIDESYRAQAPKKLVASLGPKTPPETSEPETPEKTPPAVKAKTKPKPTVPSPTKVAPARKRAAPKAATKRAPNVRG